MSVFFPQECYSCYTVLSDPPGIFICLECPTREGFCATHALEHFRTQKHRKFILSTIDQFMHVIVGPDDRLIPDPSADFPLSEFAPEDRRYPSRALTKTPDTLRRRLVAGFFNLGNTCYYNSNLHVLLAIPEFVDYCLTEDCKTSHRIGFELYRFVSELAFGNHPALINGRLRLAIGADEPAFLEPDPIDSVLFFHYIFRTLRRYIPRAPLDLSEFDVLTKVRCENCGETVQIGLEKSVYVLPIEPEVVTFDTISDTLPKMLGRWARFQNQDLKCPKCGEARGEFTRTIVCAPKYLFINDQLNYGEEEERFKQSMVLELDTEALHFGFVEGGGDFVYRLKAFMNHTGRWAKYGHDIAFVRHEEEWIRYSDRLVVEVEDIRTQVVFGQQYLYIWERIQ
jgi:uncharacterized UBP type Zn finger protein